MMEIVKRRPKAVVVGASIAGLSCAHALNDAGWEVTVIEKTVSLSSGSPTGAGLSLGPQAMEVVSRWLGDPTILAGITFVAGSRHVLHQTYDDEKKVLRVLRRDDHDDSIKHRAVHWTDLHSVIYKSLPPGIIRWGHQFLCLSSCGDGSVRIRVKVIETDKIVQLEGDLLVGADGSMSKIRQHFLPKHKLRYSGYSAWRGVFDYSEDEKQDVLVALRRTYPELGNCLYFQYSKGNHCLFYQMNNKRLNWLWYFNTPEPDREGSSVTKKASTEMIKNMHEEASRNWSPELAKLMKETKEPFVNFIYDSDPLPRLYWENVVLVGDAAHPTTPHAFKSTNMAILDAEVLGLCLKKWSGLHNLPMALQEYQLVRLPVVSGRVLQARDMGRFKQGMPLPDGRSFDPKCASRYDCEGLKLGNVPFYENVNVPSAK